MAKAEVVTKITQITSESVKKHSGKNWDQWIALLDKAGGVALKYRGLVQVLQKYDLTLWWVSIIATNYQIHKGVRVQGQNEKGQWLTNASKTMPISQKKMWNFMKSQEGLAVWLKPMGKFDLVKGANFEVEGGVYGELRTFKAPERMRFKWQDIEWDKHSFLHFYIAPRPKDQCVLIFTHENLPSARDRIKMKEHWVTVLSDVKQALQA